MLTLPFTVSRFGTVGVGSAVARVAKWAPGVSGDGWDDGTTIFYYDGGTYNNVAYNNSTKTTTLTSNAATAKGLILSRGVSEVWLTGTPGGPAGAFVSSSPASVTFAFDTANTAVNVTVGKPTGQANLTYRKALFGAQFTQVD